MPKSSTQEIIGRLHKHLLDQHKNVEPHDAFAAWFVEAEFGDLARKSALICGQSGDGGIDAITKAEGKTIVIQANYAKRPGSSNLAPKKLKEFRELAQMIVEGESDEFSRWLSRVGTSLQPEYRRRLQPVLGKPSAVEFWLVTTHKSKAADSGAVRIKSVSDVASLARLWFEKKTPPFRSLDLHMTNDAEVLERHSRFRTHIGIADVRDFMLDALDESRWESLFASNVRTDLRSRVNEKIQASYEKAPDRFWLFNNGLYIVCAEVSKRQGTVTLRYPSIINGSQTLHSIRRSRKRHSCRIIVRILELNASSEAGLLEQVIGSTNSQNPMKPYNLIAHRSEQVAIASALHRFSIFYERRQNEWKNEMKQALTGYVCVSSTELAQWLAVTTSKQMGTARSQPPKLIDGDAYKKLFGPIASRAVTGEVTQLLSVTWSGLAVREASKQVSRAYKSSAKIARLGLVRLMHDAVTRISISDRLVRRALENGRFGRTRASRISSAIVRELQKYLDDLDAALTVWNRRNREDVSLANAFKRDDLALELHSRAASVERQRHLREALAVYLEQ